MTATPILHHGDCLEIMKSLPDKSVDCFVCDLPYGQLYGGMDHKGAHPTLRKKLGQMTHAGCQWDVKIDLEQFWTQVKRLARADNTPVLMFCNTKFGIDLINSNPSWFRYDLVWDKDHGVSFLLANKMPMKAHEMVYVFSKTGAYYKRVDVMTDKGGYSRTGGYKSRQYGVDKTPGSREDGGRCVLSLIRVPGKTKRGGHPTEKPEELYKWLLERYCPEGGTVLDPTAGSFNSVKVAKSLGLRGIGIEKEEKFYKKARKEILGDIEETPATPTNTVIYEPKDLPEPEVEDEVDGSP